MLFNANVQLLEYGAVYQKIVPPVAIINEVQGVSASHPALLDLSYRARAIETADMYWGPINRNDTIVNSDVMHGNPHCFCLSVGKGFSTIVIVSAMSDFE